MIAHGGLIAKHMLHDVGHEKTFGKPEPNQHVEHWTEQSRERCEQVGNGSGPESERHKDRRPLGCALPNKITRRHARLWVRTFLAEAGENHACDPKHRSQKAWPEGHIAGNEHEQDKRDISCADASNLS